MVRGLVSWSLEKRTTKICYQTSWLGSIFHHEETMWLILQGLALCQSNDKRLMLSYLFTVEIWASTSLIANFSVGPHWCQLCHNSTTDFFAWTNLGREITIISFRIQSISTYYYLSFSHIIISGLSLLKEFKEALRENKILKILNCTQVKGQNA